MSADRLYRSLSRRLYALATPQTPNKPTKKNYRGRPYWKLPKFRRNLFRTRDFSSSFSANLVTPQKLHEQNARASSPRPAQTNRVNRKLFNRRTISSMPSASQFPCTVHRHLFNQPAKDCRDVRRILCIWSGERQPSCHPVPTSLD